MSAYTCKFDNAQKKKKGTAFDPAKGCGGRKREIKLDLCFVPSLFFPFSCDLIKPKK